MIVTIIGNVGSGKSTALPIITEAIGAESLDADNLFQTNDPFAQDYLRDQQRWAFANELWLTYERVKLIENALTQQKKDKLVIDSGLCISWVYANSHLQAGTITKAEWNLFTDLYNRLSSNILGEAKIVYLSYSIETLLQRIKKRGRDYELEFYTADYLEKLNTGLETLVHELQLKKVPVKIITEAEVADFQNSDKDKKSFISLVKQFVQSSE